MTAYGEGAAQKARRRTITLVGAVLCVLLSVTAQAAHAGGVLQVRFGGDRQETRVVIELDAATKGQVIADGATDGVLILNLAKVSADAEPQGHGLGLVGAWSTRGAGGGAQLRLQLNHPVQIVRRFLLPPSDGVSVYRYVMDLAAADAVGAAPPAAGPRPQPVAWREPSAAPAPTSPATPLRSLRLKKVIVIDAGHGGKDPGAEGSHDWEKDINLAAARALKARLERGGHYRVVMTRDTDAFVPLETRVQIARAADADLFISLHSDSGSSPDMRGATVYTLSDKGSDRVVRNVMGTNDWFINVNLPGRDRAVNQILLDLTQRATRNRSAAFAETLLDHIGKDTPLQQHSHRDAGFMVLLAPDVPAVLLEMGFITNREDEARLTSESARRRLMNGVGDAIDAYFKHQTQIAEQ
jgi:N-acetylmuramoyl-L-alanine amidase